MIWYSNEIKNNNPQIDAKLNKFLFLFSQEENVFSTLIFY